MNFSLSQASFRLMLSYIVAFVFQLTFMIVAALIWFPNAFNGVIEVYAQTANADPDLLDDISFEFSALENTEMEKALTNTVDVEATADFDAVISETFVNEDALAGGLTASNAGPLSMTKGFFGIQPTGNRIVYIIDMSVSMGYATSYTSTQSSDFQQKRFDVAVEQLLASVQQLREDQEFYVYLFCFKNKELSLGAKGVFSKPTRKNIERLRTRLAQIRLGAGTDPRESLISALNKRPSCVFLLTDGEFNGHRYKAHRGRFKNKTTVQIAKDKNKSGCPIHTIGLEDKRTQKPLIQIARQSNGIYKFIGGDE